MVRARIKYRVLPFLISIWGMCQIVYGQIYPVQATTILTPPFSGFIPDYSSPGNEQLKLLLINNDFSEPFYDVKLKIKIEGQGIVMQSKPFYFSQPFTLTPGVPVEVTGSDLAGLLSISNMDVSGISVNEYNQNKVLPEGIYSICITAYDYANPTSVQVSNSSCVAAWMMLNDPPFLNTPFCGSELSVLNPQQVTFTWTPMNLISPNSFNQTEYEFSLYEIRPNGQNPNIVIQNSAPIYQTITNQSVLNYGMTEPPLLTGMSYVWRVRAIDISGRDWFKNNGYSQVCVFKWGSELDQLGNAAQLTIQAQALTNRKGRAWWDSLNIYSSYKFEFRKAGGNNQWFPATLTRASSFVNDLESATTYEVRVQGETLDGTTGPWSNTASFTTPPLPVYVCGQMPPPVNMQNFQPLQAASINMVWQVGQFEMIVTQLNNTVNSMGIYSGYGKVLLGFAGINANCKFDQVMVDADRNVRIGVVRVMTEPLDEWIQSQTDPEFSHMEEYVYPGVIDSLFINENGQVVIIDENGSTTVVPWEDQNNILYITDNEGNEYWVLPGNFVVTEEKMDVTLNIIRLALTQLRAEYSSQLMTEKTQARETAADLVEDDLADFHQLYGIQTGVSETDLAELKEEEFEIMITSEQEHIPSASYRTKEIDVESAKVIRVFAKESTSDEELELIALYCKIDEKAVVQYVNEALNQGVSENTLVPNVKTAIVLLIKETITKKLYDSNH